MHYICSPQLTRLLEGPNNFILRLPAHNLSGLIDEADPPPINLPILWCGWLLPWDFIFKSCVVQQLGYFLSLDYHPCRIWTS